MNAAFYTQYLTTGPAFWIYNLGLRFGNFIMDGRIQLFKMTMTWLFNMKYFGIEINQQSLIQDILLSESMMVLSQKRNAWCDYHYIYKMYVVCFYEQVKKDFHGWQEYTTDCDGCVIMFDLTNRNSFINTHKWKRDVDSKCALPDGRPIPCIANKVGINKVV